MTGGKACGGRWKSACGVRLYQRYPLPAVTAVDLKVGIERPDAAVWKKFAHSDDAGIGKGHGNVQVFVEKTGQSRFFLLCTEFNPKRSPFPKGKQGCFAPGHCRNKNRDSVRTASQVKQVHGIQPIGTAPRNGAGLSDLERQPKDRYRPVSGPLPIPRTLSGVRDWWKDLRHPPVRDGQRYPYFARTAR